ncbi:hypothetical protein FOL47_000098 [Perkinsus chesapeaki]|uniref:Uncharacterized protein n=1 Tax=Perkinsus chesapeaki TaxID=330153 RepID=A0A7J6N369_PERCH|nr:hypothetical protein FOL47_000098 [Perkinsus chesapeaki]
MPFSLRAHRRIPRFKLEGTRASVIPQAADAIPSKPTNNAEQILLTQPEPPTISSSSSTLLVRDPILKGIIEATRGFVEPVELFSASMLKNPFQTGDHLLKIKDAALRQEPMQTYVQLSALERALSTSNNLDSQWGGRVVRRTLNQELNSAYAYMHGKYPDDPAAAASLVSREEMAEIVDHIYSEYSESGVAGEWIHSVDKAIPPDINDWLLFDDRTKFNGKAVYHRIYRRPTCMRVIGPPNNDDLPEASKLGTPAKTFLELMTFRSGPLRNGAHMEPWMRFLPGKVFELVRNHVSRFWRQYADYRNKRVKIYMSAMRKELPHFLAIINLKLWSLALVQEIEKAQLRQRKIDCNGSQAAFESLVSYSPAELVPEGVVKEAFALYDYNENQLASSLDTSDDIKKLRISDPSKRWVLENIATRRIPAEGDNDEFLLPYLVDWETAKLGSRHRPLPSRPMKSWLHSLGDITSYAITHEFITALVQYCLQYSSNVLVVGPDSTRLSYFLTEVIAAIAPKSSVKVIALDILAKEQVTEKDRPWRKNEECSSKPTAIDDSPAVETTMFPKHFGYRPSICPYTGRLKWPAAVKATLEDVGNHYHPQTAIVTHLRDGFDDLTPQLRAMGCLKRYIILGGRSCGSAYHTWGILPLGCPEKRISPVRYDGWEISGDLGKVTRHMLHPYMVKDQAGKVDPGWFDGRYVVFLVMFLVGVFWAQASAATLFRRKRIR